MGKYIDGYDVGVLVMKSWVPKPPGHISCAGNYAFPIYYYPVENTNNETVHGGSREIIPQLLSSAKELRNFGCRSLVTSCGYFGHFQRVIADEGIMPTYLSAVCMVPFIFRLMGKKKTLILVCYNKEKLTGGLFESCGVSKEMMERINVYDVIGEPELGKIITDCGSYDIEKGKKEVVSITQRAVSEHGDAGAILLECTDLPPYAAAIQAATNLPVFDATSMVKFVQTLPENGNENEDIDYNSSRHGSKIPEKSLGGVHTF